MLLTMVSNVLKIEELAKKKNKYSAIFITNYICEEIDILFNNIKENNYVIYGNCEIGDINLIENFITQIDGHIDYLILDVNIYNRIIKNKYFKSKIRIYSDEKCWADSIISLLFTYKLTQKFENVLICGLSPIFYRILKDVNFLAKHTYTLDKIDTISTSVQPLVKKDLSNIKFDVIISTNLKQIYFDDSFREMFNYKAFIVDAGIGGFSKNLIKNFVKNNSYIIRMDNRVALSNIFTSILENDDFTKNISGEFHYKETRVIAGGVMGLEGDIIVDSISDPSLVIGIASGNGKTIYNKENNDVLSIKELIN